MVEIFEKNKDIVKIEGEPKIDLNILKKHSKANTFQGFLIAKMKEARKQNSFDMVQLLQFIYKKHQELTTDKVELKSWKGKSTFEVFVKPEGFEVITYQKEDQDSKPKESKRNITKEEVNRVILVINHLDKGEKIHTRDIGEAYYKEEWDKIFANRFEHTELNCILRLLDYYKITHYRGPYTTILKKIKEIQEML